MRSAASPSVENGYLHQIQTTPQPARWAEFHKRSEHTFCQVGQQKVNRLRSNAARNIRRSVLPSTAVLLQQHPDQVPVPEAIGRLPALSMLRHPATSPDTPRAPLRESTASSLNGVRLGERGT